MKLFKRHGTPKSQVYITYTAELVFRCSLLGSRCSWRNLVWMCLKSLFLVGPSNCVKGRGERGVRERDGKRTLVRCSVFVYPKDIVQISVHDIQYCKGC